MDHKRFRKIFAFLAKICAGERTSGKTTTTRKVSYLNVAEAKKRVVEVTKQGNPLFWRGAMEGRCGPEEGKGEVSKLTSFGHVFCNVCLYMAKKKKKKTKKLLEASKFLLSLVCSFFVISKPYPS